MFNSACWHCVQVLRAGSTCRRCVLVLRAGASCSALQLSAGLALGAVRARHLLGAAVLYNGLPHMLALLLWPATLAPPPTARPLPPTRTPTPRPTLQLIFWALPPTPLPALLLEFREFPHPWASARCVDVAEGARQHTVTGLLPTATYELRLRLRGASGAPEGEPGPHVTADTMPTGCTPKSDSGGGGGDGGKRWWWKRR